MNIEQVVLSKVSDLKCKRKERSKPSDRVLILYEQNRNETALFLELVVHLVHVR